MHRHGSGRPSEVSEAAQVYLLTLRSMAGSDQPAMTAALARRMKVSTQAASEMVARLVHEGMLDIAADRSFSSPPSDGSRRTPSFAGTR